MLKKFSLFIVAFLIVSCDQNLTEGNNELNNALLDSNQQFTTQNSVLSDITDTAFSWLLKTELLFSSKTLFTISYNEGYNLNFEITEQQALSLLPSNLTPVKIKIIESEPEPRYYLSWYLAVMESNNSMKAIKRVDIFTYAKDQNGELALFFVSSIMEMPKSFENNWISKQTYKAAMNFFARDSQTGKPSYPHYYTDTLLADKDMFKVKLGDSSIELQNCLPVTKNELFSRDFVMANSQIYRNAVDKNVNYFNQSFINAKVETRDLGCVNYTNLSGFHPMLKNLVSTQFYGSKDKKITWYFEM